VALDRASPADLMTLASDGGAAPMNISAALVLEDAAGLRPHDLAALLLPRLAAVPRLRRRLVRTPPGCGRAVWVDDPQFSLTRHLSHEHLPGGGREELLRAQADMVCRHLPRDRPLWSARLVTGLDGGRAGVVVVLHHVLADGLGGVAALGALADGWADTSDAGQPFPAAPPTARELAAEAWRARASAVRHARAVAARSAGGLRELGVAGRAPRLVARTSLNRPTGPRRRLTVLDAPRAEVIDAAHRHGCTVNDLLLTAVAGALELALDRRGETVPSLVLSVPVAGRRADGPHDLGNRSGVRPVSVPTGLASSERLLLLARASAGWRDRPRGQSSAALAAGFRALAALHLLPLVLDHQRLVHSFVSNVPGPPAPLTLGGRRVAEVLPAAVTPGNVGVSFGLLSYADAMVLTVVADPRLLPDQNRLTADLGEGLAALLA
jgi:WS/DGAT/MGAT family acyltransferase